MAEALKSAEESVIDDELLVKAYDEAIKLPREEIARRIAMATNAHSKIEKPEENDHTCSSSAIGDGAAAGAAAVVEAAAAALSTSPLQPVSYRAGDYVRATYDADGIDYEGKVVLVDGDMCWVKYIGYGNKQEVPVADLLPSWGKKARRQQYDKAKQVDAYDRPSGSKCGSTDGVNRNNSNRVQQPRYNFGAVPPPPPMPPMLVTGDGSGGEDSEHLSAMLMSWYMSGYYTGVYQGLKIARDKSKTRKQQQQQK